MPKIFLKSPVSDKNLYLLKKEFPFFEFAQDEPDEVIQSAEVFYGSKLSEEELIEALRLQWIHTPSNDLSGLPLRGIKERGSILLSMGPKASVTQTAEFVLGGILHFAKQLHLWPDVSHSPHEFWDCPLRESMWTLSGKRILQIGLGKVGRQITRICSELGMICWGVSETPSFEPYCKKVFNIEELHSVLSSVDIISVAYPTKGAAKALIGKKELALIKEDSLFIYVDQPGCVDLKALEEIASEKRWRGVILDALGSSLPNDSPLWKIPHILITPNAASYPLEPDEDSFRLFRKNLRAFARGKMIEMRNLIQEGHL